MGKVVFTGDIHLGINIDDNIWSLETIRRYMADNNIEYCGVLGDLFHDRFKLSHDVSSRTYNFFKDTKDKFKQKWFTFPGNHDMFLKNSWEITALRAFGDVIDVHHTVQSMEIYGRKFWILPFIHLEENYMKVLNALHKKLKPQDVILTHVGVKGASLNECFLIKNWNYVTFEDIKNTIYTGHFHCHQQVGSNLWYPGSPIPFRFDEGVVDHGFIVYDTNSGTHEFVKIYDVPNIGYKPPDFITITDENIDDKHDFLGNNVRVVLQREYAREELISIREKLVESGVKSVAWLRTRDDEVDINSDIVVDGHKIDLFKMWIDHDKPDHLDNGFVFKLNEDITSTGNEKIVNDVNLED